MYEITELMDTDLHQIIRSNQPLTDGAKLGACKPQPDAESLALQSTSGTSCTKSSAR